MPNKLEHQPSGGRSFLPHEAVCYLVAVRFNREFWRIFREQARSICVDQGMGWRVPPVAFWPIIVPRTGDEGSKPCVDRVLSICMMPVRRCISPQNDGEEEAREGGSDLPRREPGLVFRFGHAKRPAGRYRAGGRAPGQEETAAYELLRRARFRGL